MVDTVQRFLEELSKKTKKTSNREPTFRLWQVLF